MKKTTKICEFLLNSIWKLYDEKKIWETFLTAYHSCAIIKKRDKGKEVVVIYISSVFFQIIKYKKSEGKIWQRVQIKKHQ